MNRSENIYFFILSSCIYVAHKRWSDSCFSVKNKIAHKFVPDYRHPHSKLIWTICHTIFDKSQCLTSFHFGRSGGQIFLSETIHDKVTSFSICGVCWSLVERVELGSLRTFFLNILLLQNSQVIHLSVTVCQCNCVLL